MCDPSNAMSRRHAILLASTAATATLLPSRRLWAQRPVPAYISAAWDAVERAVNANDFRALIRARLDVGQIYSIVSPDLHEDDRKMAFRLLEANFDPAVERADGKISGLSRFYWARFKLNEEERAVTRSLLAQIRRELAKAAQLLNGFANISFDIALESGSAALLAGDRAEGLRWLEAASDIMRSNRMTPLGGKAGEALRFADFSRMGMLKAHQLALAGDAQRAAYITEVAIGMSPAGSSRMVAAADKGREASAAMLAQAARRFDAVVHFTPTIAGTSLIITRNENGQIRSNSHDLRGPSGASFDKKDIETLQWGALYRVATASGRLGGWQGIYNAMDGAGGSSSGPTFRRGLPNMASRFWTFYVGQIVSLLSARGIKPGARVALVLPSGLSQFPIRIARDPVSGQTLNDMFTICEAADCATLVTTQSELPVSERNIAGLFNPSGDLPGADAEHALISAMLAKGRSRKMRSDSSGAAFLNELARSKADYLYLATHGSFGFTDKAGLLTGRRTSLSFDDLYASSVRLPARLAILSACETAVVSPLALTSVSQSLPNILLGKGVQGVVASLWKVSDDSTALLMHDMMRRHLVDNTPPPDALRAAQRWLASATGEQLVDYLTAIMDRNPDHDWAMVADMAARLSAIEPASRPFAEPYYWGAFAYYGS